MAKTIIEKPTCEKCGAEVRDGTTFCYSCGAQIAQNTVPIQVVEKEPVREQVVKEPIVQELVTPIKSEESDDDKMAKAANERKKARVGLRKGKEYTWEPIDDSPLAILAPLVVVLIALGVVFLMVFWK